MSTKIISWNVNGIRAAGRNGFTEWFKNENAEIVCIQETKAQPEKVHDNIDAQLLHPAQFHSIWHSAEKPGYSGVAIYSQAEPLWTQSGLGIPEIDREGRVLVAEFSHCLLINAYFPNSQRDHARLEYKLNFCREFLNFCEQLRKQSETKGKPLVICGDFNIAHKPIDLKNPESNKNNAGFLPEERHWMDTFLNHGYIDTFRTLTKDPGHYTWWSYRPGVRERNIGWRLDYFILNQAFKDRLKTVIHQPHVKGSDHCPVVLQFKN